MNLLSSLDDHKFDRAIRFFLYMLIFWLPYSPAVVESCVVISIILWVLKRGFSVEQRQKCSHSSSGQFIGFLKRFAPVSSPINKPIVFFLTVCVFSVFGSVFWEQSWHNFLTKTCEWFIVYFLVIEVFRKIDHIYIAIGILLFTSAATALDGIIQYHITHKDIFLGHMIEAGGRPTAGFKTSTSLGAYLTLVIPLALSGLMLKKGNGKQGFALLFVLFLALWALIATFSRGAWISTLLGLSLLPLIVNYHNQWKSVIIIFSLIGISVLLVGYFGWVLTSSIDLENLMRHRTVLWRLDIWRDSISMIKDKLFLGHGINTFMALFQSYRSQLSSGPTYAHNCYLQLAAETGLLGLFTFFWIIGKLFRRSFQEITFFAARNKELMILSSGLLSGIFAFLIHSAFDTNFYSLQLSVYLWFMIGVLTAVFNVERTERGAYGKS